MSSQSRRKFLITSGAVLTASAVNSGIISIARASETSPRTHKIEIRKFRFSPTAIQVNPGDTIEWTNLDVVPHTATAKDKSWDTGTIKKGESKSVMVTKGMALRYFCRFHPNMKAVLELSQ